jgi:phosphoserine aminotransferase
LGLEAGDWVVLLEVSHELSQVYDTLKWHAVVHRDADGWVDNMCFDLHDADLFGLRLKFGLKCLVSTCNSEDDIGPASVGLVDDLGFVVSIAGVDAIPENLTLLETQSQKDVPILCDWALHEKSPDTYYNTPAIFPMYVTGMNVSYMNQMGGVDYYLRLSLQKSQILWDCIDSSNGYYKSKIVDKAYRSRTNVIFRIAGGDKALEAKFESEAKKVGIVQIKAHVVNPAIRISMYNGMPLEGVIYLTQFMRNF